MFCHLYHWGAHVTWSLLCRKQKRDGRQSHVCVFVWEDQELQPELGVEVKVQLTGFIWSQTLKQSCFLLTGDNRCAQVNCREQPRVKSSLSYDGGAQRTTWSGHCEVVRKKSVWSIAPSRRGRFRLSPAGPPGPVWTRRTDSPSSPPPSSVSPSLFCTHSHRAGVKGQTVNGLRSRSGGLRLTWTFCSRRWQLLWSAGFVGNRWPWHRASGRPRTTWLKERARERKSFSWLRIINKMDGKIWKHLEMWGVIGKPNFRDFDQLWLRCIKFTSSETFLRKKTCRRFYSVSCLYPLWTFIQLRMDVTQPIHTSSWHQH